MRNSLWDILGLGVVAVDELIFVENYPPADAKIEVLKRERRCGGLAAIALAAAARLGARCAYAGVLGNDELSSFAEEFLRQEKIDVSRMKRTASAGPVHSNIVVDERRGTRTIFFELNGASGAPLTVPASLIASCAVLLVDNFGVPGMIRAARIARRAKIPVVADFENDSHPRFAELLSLANHLIISHKFASKLTGYRSAAKAVGALARGPYDIVIATCGKNGCWYQAASQKRPRHEPAFEVKAVDTTGCGDVFHGAYAFGLARNLPLNERLRLASAAAALKATTHAGPQGLPSLTTVRKFLEHDLKHRTS